MFSYLNFWSPKKELNEQPFANLYLLVFDT